MYIFQPEYLAQHSAMGLKSQKRGLPTEIIQPIRGMLKSLFLSSKFNISIKFHSFQYIFFSIFWQNFCRRILKWKTSMASLIENAITSPDPYKNIRSNAWKCIWREEMWIYLTNENNVTCACYVIITKHINHVHLLCFFI